MSLRRMAQRKPSAPPAVVRSPSPPAVMRRHSSTCAHMEVERRFVNGLKGASTVRCVACRRQLLAPEEVPADARDVVWSRWQQRVLTCTHPSDAVRSHTAEPVFGLRKLLSHSSCGSPRSLRSPSRMSCSLSDDGNLTVSSLGSIDSGSVESTSAAASPTAHAHTLTWCSCCGAVL